MGQGKEDTGAILEWGDGNSETCGAAITRNKFSMLPRGFGFGQSKILHSSNCSSLSLSDISEMLDKSSSSSCHNTEPPLFSSGELEIEEYDRLSTDLSLQDNVVEKYVSPSVLEEICNDKEMEKKRRARNRLENELLEENEKIKNISSQMDRKWNFQRLANEKRLLISLVKRQFIFKEWIELCQPNVDLHGPDAHISYIAITNINLCNALPPSQRYYLCLLSHETIVLESEIVCGETTEHIEFKEKFKFKLLGPDFKIHMKCYELIFPATFKKCMWRFIQPTKQIPLFSKFKLIAETSITFGDMFKGHVYAKHVMYPEIKTLMSAKVAGKMDLAPKLFSAFVDVISQHSITDKIKRWTHKWCVLDRTELKFWNNPDQEDQKEMLRIDLLKHTFRKARYGECERTRGTLKMTPLEEFSQKYKKSYFVFLATDEDLSRLFEIMNLAIRIAKANKMLNT